MKRNSVINREFQKISPEIFKVCSGNRAIGNCSKMFDILC